MVQSLPLDKFSQDHRFLTFKPTQHSTYSSGSLKCGLHYYWAQRNRKDSKEYYEQLYASKLGNFDEMDKFVENHKLLQLIQEGRNNLNSEEI